MLILADALARRYGCTPADVLRWPPEDLAVNRAAMMIGTKTTAEMVKESKGGVFPVVTMGGL